MFNTPRWFFRPNFGGLKKIRRLTKDPEVINHKVYWASEHKYTRRTVLSFCNNNKFTKIFARLIDPSTVKGYGLSHELSLSGPYTGFIPVDSGMSSHPSLSEEDLVDFIRSHFTLNLWLHRDIIGSSVQPWLMYNEPRKAPEYLLSLNNKQLFIETTGDISNGTDTTFINGARVLRWNLKCHNGVIHLIDKPITP